MKNPKEKQISQLKNRSTGDMKILVEVVESMFKDIENIKIDLAKPSKASAKGILQYSEIIDSSIGKDFSEIFAKEFYYSFMWLEKESKETGRSYQQILQGILDS